MAEPPTPHARWRTRKLSAWVLLLAVGPFALLGVAYIVSLQGWTVGLPMLALSLPPVIVAVQALRGRRAPTWCVVIAMLTVAGLAVVWCWAIVGGVRDDGFRPSHVLSGVLGLVVVGLCVDAIAASVLPNRPDRADSEGQDDCSV